VKKKLSSEVKTGILVTLTIAAIIWGFNLLKGRNIFHPDRDFYAVYKNIDGLVVSNAVLINGYKAGQVRSLTLLDSGKVLVDFAVMENSFFIPDNSVARIISDGLLGTKAITIELGTSKTNAVDGDTLIGMTQASLGDQVNAQIKPLKDKAQALISSIDSVMTIVQAILNKDARSSLTASFESIRKAIATLATTANRLDKLVESEGGKISSILSKLDKITGTIAANNDKLALVMKNFATLSDSLAKSNIKSTIDNANLTLQKTSLIMDKINKGEGSMGLLINDKKLYNDLDSTSANLSRLFEDMKIHPKRYVHLSVFGKKEKKATKPEIDDLKMKIGNIQKQNDDLKKQIEELQKTPH
jgi:phospholipid/cholesterol/gamma-HCH transport system substrate-binding protein